MSENSRFAADFFKICSHGFGCLAEEAQKLIRETIATSQTEEGLFADRHNSGDLYYTFFGLLLTAVTNAKINLKACRKAIELIDVETLDFVHRCMFLRIDNLIKLLEIPTFLRHEAAKYLSPKADRQAREKIQNLSSMPDDTFPQSDPNSPYSRFLLSTLYADFGMQIADFNLNSYRLKSGLYSNLKHDSEYNVNATASAMFVISETERLETGNTLRNLQQDDGSFKAIEKAPGGDVLSTGTAFFALNKFGIAPKTSVKSFLRLCFREDGLFAATPDDPQGDLEYTTYALLALGGSV